MKLGRTAGIALLMSVLTISACGQEDDPDGSNVAPTGDLSCDVTAFDYCIDYTGSRWALQDVETSCDLIAGGEGIFATAACSNPDMVGSCIIDAGTADEQILRYYDSWSAEAAETSCTSSGGSWVQ